MKLNARQGSFYKLWNYSRGRRKEAPIQGFVEETPGRPQMIFPPKTFPLFAKECIFCVSRVNRILFIPLNLLFGEEWNEGSTIAFISILKEIYIKVLCSPLAKEYRRKRIREPRIQTLKTSLMRPGSCTGNTLLRISIPLPQPRAWDGSRGTVNFKNVRDVGRNWQSGRIRDEL